MEVYFFKFLLICLVGIPGAVSLENTTETGNTVVAKVENSNRGPDNVGSLIITFQNLTLDNTEANVTTSMTRNNSSENQNHNQTQNLTTEADFTPQLKFLQELEVNGTNLTEYVNRLLHGLISEDRFEQWYLERFGKKDNETQQHPSFKDNKIKIKIGNFKSKDKRKKPLLLAAVPFLLKQKEKAKKDKSEGQSKGQGGLEAYPKQMYTTVGGHQGQGINSGGGANLPTSNYGWNVGVRQPAPNMGSNAQAPAPASNNVNLNKPPLHPSNNPPSFGWVVPPNSNLNSNGRISISGTDDTGPGSGGERLKLVTKAPMSPTPRPNVRLFSTTTRPAPKSSGGSGAVRRIPSQSSSSGRRGPSQSSSRGSSSSSRRRG